MPATTPIRSLPYPLGTDRLMDGDDQIRKLAQSVENMVQSGTVTIPITVLNTNTDVAIVFPIPFAAAPNVAVTMFTSFPQNYVACIHNGAGTFTANGFTVRGRQAAGGVGSLDVQWVAVGKVAAVS